MLADEDLAEDVCLHLQELGKFITAEWLVQYLQCSDVKLKHGIDREVGETTACRYLHELGYCFSHAKKGQYSDGHKCDDVVYYCDHVYLPSLARFQANSYIFKNDGTLIIPQITGRRTVIWYHDESTLDKNNHILRQNRQ